MDAFVARQPIFDRTGQVCAYELLFRSENVSTSGESTITPSGTVQLIANSLFSIGLGNLLGDKPAYINFDRKLLLSGTHGVLPPEVLIVEVLETVPADPEVLAACQVLREQGYQVALDDFVFQPEREPLTSLATIIKVDVLETAYYEQVRLLQEYQPRGIRMLAEKVETEAAFEQAKGAGYDLFQGYFFARPHVMKGQQIPAGRMTCLQLLAEMQRNELNFHRLNTLISHDVALSYALLLYVNSALFTHGEVRSIEHALALLGEDNIRHWVVFATLPVLTRDKPGELVTLSLVRARFCEDLAGLAGSAEPSLAFLMGLFSLLEGLTGVPIAEALNRIPVDPAIRGAITGVSADDDHYRLIYQLVCQYESGEWKKTTGIANRLEIKVSKVAESYAESILWAKQALHATARKANSRRHVRYPATGALRIHCEEPNGGERIVLAHLTNASVMGVQLETAEKISTFTRVTCNDPVSGIGGHGCVRYCNFRKGKYLIGVEFNGGSGWKSDPKLEQDSETSRPKRV
ncbi:MAG: HDOD domain-containing protein [Bryobacteraceae bacterium]